MKLKRRPLLCDAGTFLGVVGRLSGMADGSGWHRAQEPAAEGFIELRPRVGRRPVGASGVGFAPGVRRSGALTDA